MTTGPTQCFDCVNLLEKIPCAAWSCKAFPKGIPDSITSTYVLHNQKIEEQEGEFLFTPEPGHEDEARKTYGDEILDGPS